MICINKQFCLDKHSDENGNKCKRAAKLRPKTAALRRKTKYWQEIETIRLNYGGYSPNSTLPHWVFDFIGVHKNSFSDDYSLSSPMLLVCSLTSKRPEFENETFRTKFEAIKRAKVLARESKLNIFVVDCCE